MEGRQHRGAQSSATRDAQQRAIQISGRLYKRPGSRAKLSCDGAQYFRLSGLSGDHRTLAQVVVQPDFLFEKKGYVPPGKFRTKAQGG